MKRIQLFEFEDLDWFPHSIRICMTRFLVAFHRALGTPKMIVPLLQRALRCSESRDVIDLCSGSCGPMLEVSYELHRDVQTDDVRVFFSDLFPQPEAIQNVDELQDSRLQYRPQSVDASSIPKDWRGVRTLCCAMHHMAPQVARGILKDAFEQRQPIVIFEISDNGLPRVLWPFAFPFVFLLALVLTPWIRPLTWRQIGYTYILPILPLLIAWDGAVSNARTYNHDDMKELIEGLDGSGYQWEMGVFDGLGPFSKQLYLLGLPTETTCR